MKLPFGEHRHRLVNVPSVLRTAAHCDAGLLSRLLRQGARPMVSANVRMGAGVKECGIGRAVDLSNQRNLEYFMAKD